MLAGGGAGSEGGDMAAAGSLDPALQTMQPVPEGCLAWELASMMYVTLDEVAEVGLRQGRWGGGMDGIVSLQVWQGLQQHNFMTSQSSGFFLNSVSHPDGENAF